MKLIWDSSAWEDYVWWQNQDRRVLRRINALIKDLARNGNEGIGKPEALKHGFHGYWSRRITDAHRLVYKIIDDEIRIVACCYHYERYDSLHREATSVVVHPGFDDRAAVPTVGSPRCQGCFYSPFAPASSAR